MTSETAQAMLLLETYGSTTYPPKPWKGHAWAERNHCPEWLESEFRAQGYDPSMFTTVLGIRMWSEPKPVLGWELVYSYQCGEKECPDCGPGTDRQDDADTTDCHLCEGNRYVYWGDEWHVMVYAPKADVIRATAQAWQITRREARRVTSAMIQKADAWRDARKLSRPAAKSYLLDLMIGVEPKQ